MPQKIKEIKRVNHQLLQKAWKRCVSILRHILNKSVRWVICFMWLGLQDSRTSQDTNLRTLSFGRGSRVPCRGRGFQVVVEGWFWTVLDFLVVSWSPRRNNFSLPLACSKRSVNETLQVFHLRKAVGRGGSIKITTIKLPALVWVWSNKKTRETLYKTGGKFRVAGKAEPVPLG